MLSCGNQRTPGAEASLGEARFLPAPAVKDPQAGKREHHRAWNPHDDTAGLLVGEHRDVPHVPELQIGGIEGHRLQGQECAEHDVRKRRGYEHANPRAEPRSLWLGSAIEDNGEEDQPAEKQRDVPHVVDRLIQDGHVVETWQHPEIAGGDEQQGRERRIAQKAHEAPKRAASREEARERRGAAAHESCLRDGKE